MYLQRVEHDENLPDIWHDEVDEYDLRKPDSLQKLEKDIRKHLKEEK